MKSILEVIYDLFGSILEKTIKEEDSERTWNDEPSKQNQETENSGHPVFVVNDHDKDNDNSNKLSKDANPVVALEHNEEKPNLTHGDGSRFPAIQSDNVEPPPAGGIEITREDIRGKVKEMTGRDRGFSQLSVDATSNMQASSIISTDVGRDDTSIATPSIIVPNAFANDNWNLWEAVKYNRIDEVS